MSLNKDFKTKDVLRHYEMIRIIKWFPVKMLPKINHWKEKVKNKIKWSNNSIIIIFKAYLILMIAAK